MVEICLFREQNEWDQFAARCRHSRFSHLYGWGEALSSIYGLPLYRLAARDPGRQGEVVGILPLMLFCAPGAEKRCISLPYSDCAGILAENDHIAGKLLAAALELTVSLQASHLELRQAGTLPGGAASAAKPDFRHTPYSFKVNLTRRLPQSVDRLWQEVGSKVRNQVRKARKSGCSARVGGRELLAQFYAVFSENMRDLGSPVHDRRLFAELAQHLPEQMRFVVVSVGDIPAAVAAVFLHNRILYNPWASSLKQFRKHCPNMLLYWAMLACGVEYGCSSFDFGRSSPEATTCRFKRQWGAKMEPLTWHVFSRPPHVWAPDSESLADEKWQQLPLDISRAQGPGIRRWISL